MKACGDVTEMVILELLPRRRTQLDLKARRQAAMHRQSERPTMFEILIILAI